VRAAVDPVHEPVDHRTSEQLEIGDTGQGTRVDEGLLHGGSWGLESRTGLLDVRQ